MIDPKHIKAIEALIDHCYDNVPYFGTDTPPPWSDEGTRKLGEKAVRALKALKKLPEKAIVQIGLEGGLVNGGTANVPMDIVVFDYDTGMGDDDELTMVPQDGDKDVKAHVTNHTASVSPKHIRRVMKLLDED